MKSVLLGIMYERGATAIGEQFNKSAEWAQQLIDNFYKSFPKINQYRLKIENMAETYGYVTTITGRKRRLPDMQLEDKDDYRYQEAHRQSLNSVIQGSSADIMKLSMIAIYNDPRYKALDCHMIITVHDTLYDMGYRNRSGNEIDPTTISRMLSSEKYKGVYVINQRHYDFDTKKTVLNPKSEWVHIPGAVPAIVEPELWDRVQEIKGSKVQSIKNEKRGRNCGKSIFSGKIYCAKCGAKYWRSLENGYVKFKCSSYSKYGKIPGKGCDNKSFSENALYSILQSLSEQIVEVNTAEVRKSLLNWLESLRERLRASQGDDTIKEEIRKQTARKEKLTDAYMDGIISKEDYSKRYKELENTLEDLKDKLLTLEVNEDLQSIEEVIQNIDKEMEEYLQTQSFNESRVEFLNQHLTKVTVNKDSFLLEFDLIGGAILTGKDFYLFVDNPRMDIDTAKQIMIHDDKLWMYTSCMKKDQDIEG